jgi:hypothetical protein
MPRLQRELARIWGSKEVTFRSLDWPAFSGRRSLTFRPVRAPHYPHPRTGLASRDLDGRGILIRDLEPWRQARPVWDRAAEMSLRPNAAAVVIAYLVADKSCG